MPRPGSDRLVRGNDSASPGPPEAPAPLQEDRQAGLFGGKHPNKQGVRRPGRAGRGGLDSRRQQEDGGLDGARRTGHRRRRSFAQSSPRVAFSGTNRFQHHPTRTPGPSHPSQVEGLPLLHPAALGASSPVSLLPFPCLLRGNPLETTWLASRAPETGPEPSAQPLAGGAPVLLLPQPPPLRPGAPISPRKLVASPPGPRALPCI